VALSEVSRSGARQRVLAAARELFLVDGVRNVTMADVAARAGYTRQLVYKVFFGRRELIQAAAIARIEEIADATAGSVRTSTDESPAAFSASFVEVSIDVIESLRNDPELINLFGGGSPITPYEALWSDELVARALDFWRPWLDWGRAHRVLRDDLSNRDLADWLHTVYASIILRRNIPPEEERTLIERFVMTSLAMATVDTSRSQQT
jgi:AcrR family transcriptional regulator